MTDDLDRLTAALRRAPPPDPGARDVALRLALFHRDARPLRGTLHA